VARGIRIPFIGHQTSDIGHRLSAVRLQLSAIGT